jgi:hypothetical protein
VNLSIPEPKSDNEVMLISRLDNMKYILDMEEEEESKGW